MSRLVWMDHARTSLPKAPEALAAMRRHLDLLELREPDRDLALLDRVPDEVEAVRRDVAP